MFFSKVRYLQVWVDPFKRRETDAPQSQCNYGACRDSIKTSMQFIIRRSQNWKTHWTSKFWNSQLPRMTNSLLPNWGAQKTSPIVLEVVCAAKHCEKIESNSNCQWWTKSSARVLATKRAWFKLNWQVVCRQTVPRAEIDGSSWRYAKDFGVFKKSGSWSYFCKNPSQQINLQQKPNPFK